MPVTYEVDEGVATLTIDRPERRNAIDGPTADALQGHFERSPPTRMRACSS